MNGWHFGHGHLWWWKKGLHYKSPSKHAPILFFGSRPFSAFPLVLRNIHHPETTIRLLNTWTLAYSIIYCNCICWCVRTDITHMLSMPEVHWQHFWPQQGDVGWAPIGCASLHAKGVELGKHVIPHVEDIHWGHKFCLLVPLFTPIRGKAEAKKWSFTNSLWV